jgi:hypothetical protein
MGFLLKTAFWVGLVLLILPIDRQAAGISNGPSTLDTMSAVRTVVSDVRGFCDRNASACDTGAATLTVLRQKAVYSAGVVQAWLANGDEVPGSQTLQVHAEAPQSADIASLIGASTNRIPANDYPPL